MKDALESDAKQMQQTTRDLETVYKDLLQLANSFKEIKKA